MRKTMTTIGIASLILSGLTAVYPAYAEKQKQPSMQPDMMKGGGMDGVMGMMEQMSKMTGLCTR